MNRRDLFLSLLAISGFRPATAFATTPALASCFGAAHEPVDSAGPMVHPSALAHHEILAHLESGRASVGRTIITVKSDSPAGYRHRGATYARALGDAGLWIRQRPTARQHLRIGVIGPAPKQMISTTMETIAAGDSVQHLASGRIDAVFGLTPTLGWALGLQRHAPYFMPMPGYVTWEEWHGPRNLVMERATSPDNPTRMTDITTATLAHRGIQIIATTDRTAAIHPGAPNSRWS